MRQSFVRRDFPAPATHRMPLRRRLLQAPSIKLAYDKGMRILAATQADNVALESEKLGQGLLTYRWSTRG
jgi:hypothetical protein